MIHRPLYQFYNGLCHLRLLRWLRSFFWGTSWGIILLLAVFVAARFWWYDGWTLFVWVNLVTLYFYLPAYGIGLVALYRRRYKLAAMATAVILCHLWWISPNFTGRIPDLTSNRMGPTLRLFSMNLTVNNTEVEAIVDEIGSVQPDILLFQEYNLEWQTALKESGLFETYLYGLADENSHPYGTAIWSKYPIGVDVWELEDTAITHATIELEDQAVQLFNLHLPGLMDDFHRWNDRMAAAAQTLLETEGPVIAMGDYNQTPYNRWYQVFTNGRLRDAHQTCGNRWATTWPNGTRAFPGILLDHALLSPEIACMNVWEGRGQGSEHKSIILDIALLREAP